MERLLRCVADRTGGVPAGATELPLPPEAAGVPQRSRPFAGASGRSGPGGSGLTAAGARLARIVLRSSSAPSGWYTPSLNCLSGSMVFMLFGSTSNKLMAKSLSQHFFASLRGACGVARPSVICGEALCTHARPGSAAALNARSVAQHFAHAEERVAEQADD